MTNLVTVAVPTAVAFLAILVIERGGRFNLNWNRQNNIQPEESNIYLIGMMGSGKTTVGKLLAEKLNYDFFDTDNLIEKSSKTTIEKIFDTQGEAKFRELESQTLEEVSNNYSRSVIATGGGIVQTDKNWEYLSQGLSIWLDVDLNLLNQRLAKDKQTHRPLINQLESLLTTRRPHYAKAKLRIPIKSEQTPEALVTKIINLIFNELH